MRNGRGKTRKFVALVLFPKAMAPRESNLKTNKSRGCGVKSAVGKLANIGKYLCVCRDNSWGNINLKKSRGNTSARKKKRQDVTYSGNARK